MTVYADASAILKLYLVEPNSDVAAEILRGDPLWVTGYHTLVEVRRNLARVLESEALADACGQFSADWSALEAVELDHRVCEQAADLAERTGARALAALHLGAAAIAGADDGLPVVTFDRPMGEAARSLGWEVLGA